MHDEIKSGTMKDPFTDISRSQLATVEAGLMQGPGSSVSTAICVYKLVPSFCKYDMLVVKNRGLKVMNLTDTLMIADE